MTAKLTSAAGLISRGCDIAFLPGFPLDAPLAAGSRGEMRTNDPIACEFRTRCGAVALVHFVGDRWRRRPRDCPGLRGACRSPNAWTVHGPVTDRAGWVSSGPAAKQISSPA